MLIFFAEFEFNRYNELVKLVHTNIFAKDHKLHKFATTHKNFFLINYFTQATSHNVHVYQFSAKFVFSKKEKILIIQDTMSVRLSVVPSVRLSVCVNTFLSR